MSTQNKKTFQDRGSSNLRKCPFSTRKIAPILGFYNCFSSAMALCASRSKLNRRYFSFANNGHRALKSRRVLNLISREPLRGSESIAIGSKALNLNHNISKRLPSVLVYTKAFIKSHQTSQKWFNFTIKKKTFWSCYCFFFISENMIVPSKVDKNYHSRIKWNTTWGC